jgi:Leucine-rich repeat (LRR) protein
MLIFPFSETALYNLGELQYLNLESNLLSQLPVNLLHKNVHKQLLDVRLSYNRLLAVRTGSFSALPRLQTVGLAANRLVRVEAEAFRHLPNLVTLVLTHNKIQQVDPRAFVHLDNLQKVS